MKRKKKPNNKIPPNFPLKTVGDMFFMMRQNRRLSRKELSNNVNISIPVLVNIESGFYVSLESLLILTSFYGTNLIDFLFKAKAESGKEF